MVSVVGEGAEGWREGREGEVGFGAVNSPWAMSIEALPSGTFENQPPGKKRDDAVDSSLERGEMGSSSG